MDIDQARHWATGRRNGVLVTIREDGRPQSSDIAYAIDGDDFLISVTNTRAKTANMRRDNRVVLHLSEPSAWSYVSFDGTVELTPVTEDPQDPTADQLVAYYRAVSGAEHPDWSEYRAAMVADRRLLARFTPQSVVGQINT